MSNLLEDLDSRDYLMIHKNFFTEITHSVVDFFGNEGAAFISFLGFTTGRLTAKKNLESSDGDSLKALEYMVNLKRNQNWADLDIIELDKSKCTGKIWVKSCFCQNDEIHDCYYLKGFLSGFLSEIFQIKINITVDLKSLITNNSYKMSFQPSISQKKIYEKISN